MFFVSLLFSEARIKTEILPVTRFIACPIVEQMRCFQETQLFLVQRCVGEPFYKRNTVSYGTSGPRIDLNIIQYPESFLENPGPES